jgi:dipeptidase E
MKTLVLLSNQIVPGSEKLEREWLALLGKTHPLIGYIPSCSDPERLYFREQAAYYTRCGAEMAVYFELEAAYAPERLAELLACDAIHLSGGNTFHFLHWLRQRSMLGVLQRYVAEGGILIGASAGAILMTADIGTSILCGDNPQEADPDWSGLGLVNFAFVPHLDSIPDGAESIQNYANRQQVRVYACRDGDGLIVQNDQIRCFGDVLCVEPEKHQDKLSTC